MIAESKCHKRGCLHFIGVINDGTEETERVVCKAYPNGIPNDIAYGTNKHSEIQPDQLGGYIYEKEEDE